MTIKYIDLSHTIEDGLITFNGSIPVKIYDYLSREESRGHYAPGTEFQISKIEMLGAAGTYMDSPYHRYDEAEDLSDLRLSQLCGIEGVCVSVAEQDPRFISHNAFSDINVKNKAVLIRTGWSRFWRTPAYFRNHPYLTRDAAEYLKAEGAVLVGIDSMNIDDTSDAERPVHSILLRSGILIIEHMTNLDQLPAEGFEFFAVPPKIKRCGSFPVRCFAVVS